MKQRSTTPTEEKKENPLEFQLSLHLRVLPLRRSVFSRELRNRAFAPNLHHKGGKVTHRNTSSWALTAFLSERKRKPPFFRRNRLLGSAGRELARSLQLASVHEAVREALI